MERLVTSIERKSLTGAGWAVGAFVSPTLRTSHLRVCFSLETYETSEYSRKGCDFLLKHQRDDGGWGESWEL